MWSLGIITLCLLTGDAFISFEELQDMSQADIAVKLAEASRDYPQWRHLNLQGKDFIKKLLVLEPLKRMTAKDAVNHDWFRKPARVALELDKLYERSIVFWSKRSNHIGIVEDLPNVVPEKAQPEKGSNARRKSSHQRIPDAASPYFGLERHLHPRGARSRSRLYSQRKRLLAELKEADTQFIVTMAQPKQDIVPKVARPEKSFRLQNEDFPIDMSDSAPPILRPIEPSSTGTAITMSLAARSRQPTDTAPRRRISVTSNSLVANRKGQRMSIIEGPESGDGEAQSGNVANKARHRQPSAKTGPFIRQVDANDLFGTIPIEIKAAEAAEAAHAAYDDLFQSFLDNEDEEMADDSAERPAKPLTRSYILSQDDRELYDEAAKDLPKLSTAKAFSQAIAKRKQLKGSQEDRTSSAAWANDTRPG
jgi:hypothetical protein